MTDNTATESGTLVRIKVVLTEFATSHTTNRVDEVGAVEILKPILIRVVSVGPTVEVIGRRIFTTLLVTCILGSSQHMCNDGLEGTYTISFFVEHEGSNGPPGVGAIPGLTTDTDSGAAPAVLILSTGDGASRHRHGRVSGSGDEEGDNRGG